MKFVGPEKDLLCEWLTQALQSANLIPLTGTPFTLNIYQNALQKRSVSGSGTGPLDTNSRGPVPDPEPLLWGMSRGPVVCETTTDKPRDTGS